MTMGKRQLMLLRGDFAASSGPMIFFGVRS